MIKTSYSGVLVHAHITAHYSLNFKVKKVVVLMSHAPRTKLNKHDNERVFSWLIKREPAFYPLYKNRQIKKVKRYDFKAEDYNGTVYEITYELL